MQEITKGIVAVITSATIWGVAPVYYSLLKHVPPVEILSHRTLWSFLFFAIVLMYQKRLVEIWEALYGKKAVLPMLIASVLIATNWFFFIYSVQTGQATQASLGYFIMPLVSVVFGVAIFKENLSCKQFLAVFLAAFAVLLLTYGLGVPPWIALIISISFALYGVIKKHLAIRPTVAVTIEVLFGTP